MAEFTIDLNADLGERPEASETDAELMRYVTSANIACGGHAGNAETMWRSIELAKELGVSAGAHPSFPDLANFGRLPMRMSPEELESSILHQLELISGISAKLGTRVTHVKPHGALYHSANSEPAVAAIIAKAICTIDSSMIAVAQCGSLALDIYRQVGLQTAAEAFADRAYEPDGTLRSRSLPGALLSANRAVEQALSAVMHGFVICSDGARLIVKPDTLCIHSDTPGAAKIARGIREELEGAGIRVKAPRR